MKRFLLLIMLFCLSVYADEQKETVYLDLSSEEEHRFKVLEQRIEDLNINNKEDEEDYIYHPMEYVKQEAKELFLNRDKSE